MVAAAVRADGWGRAALQGCVPSLRRQVEALARAHGLDDAVQRRRALPALAVLVVRRPIDAAADLDPRARALLILEVDRDTGARWLAEAPLARRGWRPQPGLVAALRRVASAAPRFAEDPDVARLERGRGREWLVAAIAGLDADARGRWLAALGECEAAAVLAMEAVPRREPGSPPGVASAAAWFALASSLATEPEERSRVLGALVFGAEGDMNGDGRSWRWRRAGAQMRALEESEWLA